MPKKQISEIKKLARSKLKQISTTSDQALAEVSMLIPIAEINFSKRTSGVLKQHNVKFVSDLKNLDLGQLKKNPTIGKQQLLEVQRLAFDYGIKLNLN
mgnify:CR=1 FL=1